MIRVRDIDSRRCQRLVIPLLLAVLTRWLHRQDLDVFRYLVEENRVLRRQAAGPTPTVDR